MKKIFFGIFLLLQVSVYAQDINKNETLKIFIGAGAIFDNNYEIEKYLVKNDFADLKSVQANITAGLIFYNKDVDIDLGYDLAFNSNGNEISKNRSVSNGFKIRAHYVVLNLSKVAFSAGTSFAYLNKKLTVFDSSRKIDLNNLGNPISGNQITLSNQKLYLGPSISSLIKVKGVRESVTKITLGYEFSLNNKDWQSDTFEIINKISEKNNTRVVLNIVITL